MYELIQVSENTFYIQSPAKIGLVKIGENEVCLIDSGNDKDAGKKVKKILYAPGIECDFTQHPILEPAFLYGGNPPKDLRHKFLMAQESQVLPLTKEVLPVGWEMISLFGHSFEMVGFRTQDNVVFLADCLSSEATLEKYQINFLIDVEAYLKTLENVKEMHAKTFIPAHADATEDIAPLAQMNIEKVHQIADKIIRICQEPICFEHILKQLFDEYNLVLSFEQYALVGSTIRSYLTWLKESGRLQVVIEDNMLLWKAQNE